MSANKTGNLWESSTIVKLSTKMSTNRRRGSQTSIWLVLVFILEIWMFDSSVKVVKVDSIVRGAVSTFFLRDDF